MRSRDGSFEESSATTSGSRGRWFITPHAVRRYIERCPGARPLTYEQALARLIRESEKAHMVKARRNPGEELWRGGKPHRLRFVVARGNGGMPQLVTVLRGCDAPGKRDTDGKRNEGR